MSTQKSRSGYVSRNRTLHPECLERWAPRCPMTQLPDEYRVTDTNKDPPLIHFAIPIDEIILFAYAMEHDLTHSDLQLPDVGKALKHLSRHVEYDVNLRWPFEATADCGLILALYNNYTMEDKMLIEEDQEDVIRMVQRALGLDKSMRPQWYFDWEDLWRPGADDEVTDSESDDEDE